MSAIITNTGEPPRRLFSNAYVPFGALGLLLVVLAGKLVWVQFVQEKELSKDVDRIIEKRLRIAAPRGRIIDASGVVLAGTRGTVHLVADGKELRKVEERNAARRVPFKGQTVPPEIVNSRREEMIRMRADFILDLAGALDATVGAAGGVEARAKDIAARLGRFFTNDKGETGPATYIPIAKKISTDEEDRVRAVLKHHGMSNAFGFEEDFERTYPAGASVASVVGFLGARVQNRENTQKTDGANSKDAKSKVNDKDTKNSEAANNNNKKPAEPDRVGQGGIEQYHEEKLRGVAGFTVVQRAPTVDGGFMDLDRDIPPVPGCDIQLTIDAKLSSILQEEAENAFSLFSCDALAGVAIDAYTGRVLAMAAVPGFNPNPAPNTKNYPLNNFAIGYSYEPGSSIKPFTVAAALESGAITRSDEFDVNFPSGWPIPKRSKPIRDSHAYNGSLDVTGILARSSNIGAVKIGQKAGSLTIAEAFSNFGFNNKTGVESPVEGKVQLPNFTKPWDVPNTLSSVSFGYQFYATTLRLASAYGILVNGGMRIEPRLVDSIHYPDGHVEHPTQPAPARVLSEETCRTVREMLTSVITDEHGTGHAAAAMLVKEGFEEVYDFAGKTGTAVIHKNPSHMNGTFAVFGPMPDPRIVVVFVVFNSSARFGGTQCALPAMRALARSLRALGILSPGTRALDLEAPGSPPVISSHSMNANNPRNVSTSELTQTNLRSTSKTTRR